MHTSLATYQVFLTRNSEYHLQSHVCVGVRDRRTGRWLAEHPALQRSLSTTVRTAGQLAPLQKPQLGESLEFDLDGAPLRTSPVLNIEERGGAGASQRSVMAPRASQRAPSGLDPSATLPAAPPLAPPAPTAAKPAKPANTNQSVPKSPASTTRAKAARWLFRRRPRVPTAERNLAQAERAVDDTLTTTTPARPDEPRRLAR